MNLGSIEQMALVPYQSPTDIKEHQQKQYEDNQLYWSRRFCTFPTWADTQLRAMPESEPLTWYVYPPRSYTITFPIQGESFSIGRCIQRWYESMKACPGPRRELFSL